MYKILIKYNSTLKKVYWRNHVDDESNDFKTDDLEVLKEEIKKLDKIYGYDNIRIVNDLTYDVLINLNAIDLGNAEIATSEDVSNVFDTAYNKIFGGA